MDRSSVALTTLAALVALGLAAGASAQDKQLYRYTDADGHVVYTDKPPPPSAKNVQPQKITANVIETNEIPLAAQLASEKYPVTLFTYDCGEICRNAEALLNRRGVPFTTINVADKDGMAKLQALTGGNAVPVLQVGEKMVAKGLLETRWQSMLDEAGYPKTPAPRRTPPARANEASARAETASPASATPTTPAAPPADGGYPK
ncbi:MAG: glutaredoxin family protein [Betaproteobacteria bacterium]|nr:MAG: glutaredoxin family protein [Betaproteobacteria bacterium]